jgi:hypothetical protein
MRRLHRFWKCLDERADTASPLERWRRAAGPDFDVLERFLVPGGDGMSPVYPCPECGRDLIVVPMGEAIVAEPDEDAPCQPLERLSVAEVREFGLNWAGIVRAVAAATGCPLDLDGVRDGCVCARGDWVHDFRRIAVAARFGENDRVVSEEALRLTKSREGALLLTGQHRRKCEGLLAGTGCGYVALEDVMGVDEGGRLVCACDLTARLAPAAAWRELGESAAGKAEWVFLDEGASYRVVMPEGEFTMPKRAGEMYLHWFARNPRQERRALDLVSQVRGTGGRKTMADWDEDEGTERAAAGDGENVDGFTTREALGGLRKRLKAIKTERDRAENEGDMDRVGRLDDEVEVIEGQIAKDTNRFGKIRKVANDDAKAAASIVRELNRAYERLRKAKGQRTARTAFAEHFKRQLTIGYMCRYDVPMERDWMVMGK